MGGFVPLTLALILVFNPATILAQSEGVNGEPQTFVGENGGPQTFFQNGEPQTFVGQNGEPQTFVGQNGDQNNGQPWNSPDSDGSIQGTPLNGPFIDQGQGRELPVSEPIDNWNPSPIAGTWNPNSNFRNPQRVGQETIEDIPDLNNAEQEFLDRSTFNGINPNVRGGGFNDFGSLVQSNRQSLVGQKIVKFCTPLGKGLGFECWNGRNPDYDFRFDTSRNQKSLSFPQGPIQRPTFTQSRPTFTQPRPTFTQSRPTFTQSRPIFSQPRPTFTQPRPIVNNNNLFKTVPNQVVRPTFNVVRPGVINNGINTRPIQAGRPTNVGRQFQTVRPTTTFVNQGPVQRVVRPNSFVGQSIVNQRPITNGQVQGQGNFQRI